MEISKLNPKHRLFVEAYIGDTLEAMQLAGFEGPPQKLKTQGDELLKQPLIIEAIRQRAKYNDSTAKIIATREERQAFWTSLMRNNDPHYIPEVNDKGVTQPISNLPLPIRIKASELLGKSETDFVERLDMNHKLSITDVIKESYSIELTNIDAIEEQYEQARRLKNNAITAEFSSAEVDEIEAATENSLESFI